MHTKRFSPFARQAGYSVLEIMIVVGLAGVIGTIAVPMMGNTLRHFRLSGAARSVSQSLTLAKVRSAATFSQTRVFVDLDAGSFRNEIWDKDTATWVPEGGAILLDSRTDFSFGIVAAPPPNTQGDPPRQAAPCLDNQDPPEEIGNTSCIVFNSRGIPVDATGPIGTGAFYLTDGTLVYALTVAATGAIRMWRTNPTEAPNWILQ